MVASWYSFVDWWVFTDYSIDIAEHLLPFYARLLFRGADPQSVRTFTDSIFSDGGTIGLAADDFTGPTSVVYTDAIVWQ